MYNRFRLSILHVFEDLRHIYYYLIFGKSCVSDTRKRPSLQVDMCTIGSHWLSVCLFIHVYSELLSV